MKKLWGSIVMIGYDIAVEAKWNPIRVVILALLIAILVVLPAKAQTFPLNKKIADKTLVCMSKDAAAAIAESIVPYPAMAQAIYISLMNDGTCFNVEGMMTYQAQVYETATHWYVYPVEFGGMKGFVPTKMKSDELNV